MSQDTSLLLFKYPFCDADAHQIVCLAHQGNHPPGVCKGDLVIKDDVVAREIVPHARHECIRPVDQHTVNVAAVQVLQTGLCTLAHILRAMAVIEDLHMQCGDAVWH
eukprot:1138230-Pelagomonas_calceolata.AAC.2